MARNEQIGRSSNPTKVERIINLRAALDVALMLLNLRRQDDSTKELTSVIGTTDLPRSHADVCLSQQIGQHLLRVSFSAFDPEPQRDHFRLNCNRAPLFVRACSF